jgi:hypothetical protein
MGRRPALPASVGEPHLLGDRLERGLNIGDQQRLTPKRDEYVIVERGVGSTLLQVALEASASTFMQWNQPALLELGLADQQTIRRNVFVSQPDGF